MTTQEPVRCRRCGGKTSGYKCDVCGAESPVHVESHRCGGPHCMPKCAGCYEAEALCDCEPLEGRASASLQIQALPPLYLAGGRALVREL